MKLEEIIKEIYSSYPEENKDDLIQKGFRLGDTTVNPVTGRTSSEVEYLPEFEKIRRYMMGMRKQFQPYKFSSNEDVSKLSKDINNNLFKISQQIYALDKILELQRKTK